MTEDRIHLAFVATRPVSEHTTKCQVCTTVVVFVVARIAAHQTLEFGTVFCCSGYANDILV